MDDLGKTIQGVLSDPEAMEQLRTMAEAMGLGVPSQEQPPPSGEELFSSGQLAALLSALNRAALPAEAEALLQSLRSLMGEEKRQKLDRAERALKLMAAARTVSSTLTAGGEHVQSLF